ncbi:hypothetical protein IV102_20050 [bacterium]|nr:hypothetical protein [bacterium]
MAFQVNSNTPSYSQVGARPTPPTGGANEQQPAQPQDRVNLQGTPPPSDPLKKTLSNGLQLKYLQQNGQTTGLYATLPGGPGGLLAAPVLVSVSLLPGQNTLGGQFQQASAYEVGADGKAVRDEQGQPKALPTTVMSDGRIYVQTKANDPNAPLVMLDCDGSYGLSTPARLKVEGDAQGAQGYTREQSEFVKPDNTRGFRVNEEVGGFGQASQGSGLAGMASMLTMGLAPSGPSGGRDVTYTEVQQTAGGALESRDLHFTQAPNQNWPQFSEGFQWKSLIAMNAPDSRERSVVQEGPGLKLEGGWSGKRMLNLFTGKAGLGVNSWTYGKQETIRFVPLSRQQGLPPQAPSAPTPPPIPATPPPLPTDF